LPCISEEITNKSNSDSRKLLVSFDIKKKDPGDFLIPAIKR
jgi:hypothetical protein